MATEEGWVDIAEGRRVSTGDQGIHIPVGRLKGLSNSPRGAVAAIPALGS